MKAAPAPSKPKGSILWLTIIAVGIVILGFYLFRPKSEEAEVLAADSLPGTHSAAVPLAGSESSPEAIQNESSSPNPAFKNLVGRWLREDGGYVLEIREVKSDGTLTAAYFNPRPIHVSKAAAVTEGGNVVVGIELTDVNYPGCLYHLVLNAPLDQLQGTYFQAALGQTFEVVFIRIPAN